LQRTNYLKIFFSLTIAGLLVFGFFRFLSQNVSEKKESAKKDYILRHVELTLRCYQTLVGDAATLQASKKTDEAGENPSAEENGVDVCDDQAILRESTLDTVSDLLEKTGALKKWADSQTGTSNDDAEQSASDEVGDGGFLEQDFEKQLASFRIALPFPNLWNPELSTTIYDSLTTSGEFYLISSDSLAEELTKLKLAHEHLSMLEHNFNDVISKRLNPLLMQLDVCEKTKVEVRTTNSESDNDAQIKEPEDNADNSEVVEKGANDGSRLENDCNTPLVDGEFLSMIENLNELVEISLAIKSQMEKSRQLAIAELKK